MLTLINLVCKTTDVLTATPFKIGRDNSGENLCFYKHAKKKVARFLFFRSL